MATYGEKPEPALIVIVGPTASGKTNLAIKVAKELNGEVISADSRAIYMGMDIGSAKPTVKDMQGIPHWGFDLVRPGERFTAVDFQRYANEKIVDIRSRGRVPIIAGGTGLYVDAVIYNYQFPLERTKTERKKYENMSLNDLYDYCAQNNVSLPENKLNKRYVVNSILRQGQALKRNSTIINNIIVVGITTERAILRTRIKARTDNFMQSGVLEEAQKLAKKYGWESEAMTGNIYPLARAYAEGSLDYNSMIEQFNIKEWHLAKRQLTWFKRNKDIQWLSLDDAYTYIIQQFARLNKS